MASTCSRRPHRGGPGPPARLPARLHGHVADWSWCCRRSNATTTSRADAGRPRGRAGLAAVVDGDAISDAVERAMDEAGFELAHVVGNSLGGFVALPARGARRRDGRRVAPAGGWANGDDYYGGHCRAPAGRAARAGQGDRAHAEALVATVEAAGARRRPADDEASSTIPATARPSGARRRALHGCAALVEYDARAGLAAYASVASARCGSLGTEDELLPWPAAAVRYRETDFPHADGIELDGIRHCPQLDVPLEAAQLVLGLTAPSRAGRPGGARAAGARRRRGRAPARGRIRRGPPPCGRGGRGGRRASRAGSGSRRARGGRRSRAPPPDRPPRQPRSLGSSSTTGESGEPGELAVERGDLGQSRGSSACSEAIAACTTYGPRPRRASARSRRRARTRSGRRPSSARSWSASRTSSSSANRAARRASCSSISACRPCTSGSSGMSCDRARPSRSASAARSPVRADRSPR